MNTPLYTLLAYNKPKGHYISEKILEMNTTTTTLPPNTHIFLPQFRKYCSSLGLESSLMSYQTTKIKNLCDPYPAFLPVQIP